MQRFQQTVKATFNKGLITEASEMAFPDEASVDELNVDLTRKGTRRRRLGLEIEDGDTPSSETYPTEALVQTQEWTNVGNNADLNYLVLQVGNKLRFYKKGAGAASTNEVPISDADPNPYIIDLSTFNSSTGVGASSSKVECTTIEGRLVVASPQIDTFYIERDNDTGAFTTQRITFRIRDFEWVGDKETYRTAGAQSNARFYDSRNAGWNPAPNGADALLGYIGLRGGNMPPLTHPWFSGKNSSGNFDINEWEKVYSGSSLQGNGRYILDLFTQDRSAASGYGGLPSNPPTSRFSTVATYAGRVFYSGVDSRVYFSRIIEEVEYLGDLYQVNDPTSEYFNDLLDTDGGYIRIPEASNIKKLHVFGASILVFADNGVWRISGVDDVFRATEFSVSKISEYGLAVRNSFVAGANNLPFWWSYSGIHTIEVTERGGFREVNISRGTIQTFWDEIGNSARGYVTGVYDTEDDKIVWAYPNAEEGVPYKLNRFLIFDVGFQAFFPWEIADKDTNTPKIVGLTYFGRNRSETSVFTVIDEDGNTVVDSDGNTVVATLDVINIGDQLLKTVVMNSDGTISFATFTGIDFLDWNDKDYSSYLVSSYNFIGDVTRFKTSPYITLLLKVTETGITGAGDLVRPSSVLVSAYWDFSKTPATSSQQGYRLKSIPWGDFDTFNYPNTIVQTKLKLRGRGRVVSLRFEAETGKDFDIVGWETIDAINTNF